MIINGELLPEKLKGCCKGTRKTGELLYIDKHFLKESNMRWKNLAKVWIDYKKVYDIVPQSWIIDCPKMNKISCEVKVYQEFHGKLESGDENLERDLPLLFVIAIIPLRKCIGGYKLHKSLEKLNHLMNMEDIKLPKMKEN